MDNIFNNRCLWMTLFYFIVNPSFLYSQDLTKEDSHLLFTEISQKKIVALGDATHTDYTASKFRVQLIKELVEQHDFTIICIESNLYEVYKAFEGFKTNGDIATLNSSLYYLVRNNELDELFYFLKEQNEKGNHIKVLGFDANFSGDHTYQTFIDGMQSNLHNTEMECQGFFFEDFSRHFKKLMPTNFKALLRTNKNLQYVQQYISCYLNNHSLSNRNKIFHKSLSNIEIKIDSKFRGKHYDNTRDSLMFDNILYIQNWYPNEKMILFGSSSHFIKSPQEIHPQYMPSTEWTSLGARLSNRFGEDYSFIAYTGVTGNTRGFHGKKVKLKKLIPNSIEYIANELYDSKQQNMYLSIERDKKIFKKAVYSRFLGNTFMEMDISSNIDGLFLIRNNNME